MNCSSFRFFICETAVSGKRRIEESQIKEFAKYQGEDTPQCSILDYRDNLEVNC
jgi:hypothetical protein